MYNYKKKYRLLFFIVHLTYGTIIFASNTTDHHVICSLKKTPQNKDFLNACNEKIHDATYEINLACKKLYKNNIENNEHYPHRRNTVFIIHINHNFNSWTLFKPSFINYEKFVKLIKKIYRKNGLDVFCYPDQEVKITKSNDQPGAHYLTLDEFERYKKTSDEEIEKTLKDQTSSNYDLYQKIKKTKKFLFWHLQIPTTGLYRDARYDIPDFCKPLAWHYLLWDLAPKKGQGAHVAIIDTGASAFNVQDTKFSKLYKKNINLHAGNNLLDYGYNLVSKDGLDPIRQITINLANFCDHQKFDSNDCMEKLPEMIIEIIKNKNKIQFEQYFIKNAKNRYLSKSKDKLNEEGEVVLKDLLYGKYGITPLDQDPFFHIIHLPAPYNEQVLLETLPTPKIIGDTGSFAAGHGTFTQGVINGKQHDDLGITGLAPQAQVTMIKAFNDKGTTNKTTLNAALQRAITLKNPIVSMSLKITDEIDKTKDAHLKELIDSIDYVVAASGNDGQIKKLKNKEAYPAKFDSVAFDVGAFEYDDGNYPICPFTQMELNVGPKFVAPGKNLFSSGLTPGQTEDSMYVFMTGTSIAVPVIAGFMALVLAEFQDVFSREQILKVMYKFSIKFGDDDIWKKYIKLGTPYMRSALLCLHVLQSLKALLTNNANYQFDTYFDNLVQAIWIINYCAPSMYEAQIGKTFTNDFAGFYQQIKEQDLKSSDFTFFNPKSTDLSDCINFISKSILYAIDNKKSDDLKKISDHANLIESLHNILVTQKYSLFAQQPKTTQLRIAGALAPRNSCMIS